MRRLVIALLAIGVFAASTASAANAVRISKVYGGGGSTVAATFMHDYVELYNSSCVAVNLGGLSLQYGSATGLFGSSATNYYVFPANTMIPACGYFLVRLGQPGTAGGYPTTTPDLITTNLSISATNGKVALMNLSTFPPAGTPCTGSTLGGVFIDVVGFGSASCYEGTAMPVLTNITMGVRNNGGIADTDNNSADFTAVGHTSVPFYNSTSTNAVCVADCAYVPAIKNSWGQIKTMYR
jgi:hypothetical protein